MVCQIGVIKGKVIDAKTKKPLVGAIISLGNDDVTKTTTDSSGKFEISIANYQNETIYVSYEGYKLIEKKVSLKPNETRTINFEMSSYSIKLRETKITSKRNKERSKDELVTEIEVNTEQTNPSGNIENVLKFQGMGVGGNNELGSQFSVRGGSFDENLLYVNDFEVYRPLLIRNAQQEGLSFANSQLVQNMKFSSGGFSPEYGDKLSSVLDIQYKKPKNWAGSLEAGLLGVNGHIEGSLFDKKLNILTGIRYRNNAYLLGSQETKGQYTPEFLDIQSNLHFQPSSKLDFESLSVISFNKFSIIPSDRETNFGLANFALTYRVAYSGQEIDRYQNWMQANSITFKPNPNLKIKLAGAYYHIDEKQYFDITGQYAIGEIETDVNSSNYQGFKNVFGSGTFQNWGRESYQANLMHGHLSLAALLGKHTLKLGVKVKNEEFQMRLSSWDRLDSAGYNIPSNSNQVLLLNPIRADYQFTGQRLEFYLQDQWTIQISDKKSFSILGGIRGNYWSINKEFFVSPRLQMIYKTNPKTSFYAAVGSYNQTPFIREMINERGQLITNVKSQKSLHYIAGVDVIMRILKRPFKFTTEAYYKHMWDVNTYQYNNVLVRYAAKNNVIAYARGIDLRLQGEFVKDAESWINIGILDTREFNGANVFMKYRDTTGKEVYDKRYAQGGVRDSFLETQGYIQRPNNQFLMVNIFFQDYIPQLPSFKVNLSLTLASGLPFGVPNSEVYRNQFNLLAYKRLDIGFAFRIYDSEKKKKPKSMIKNIWATLDVFNAVDFFNQVSMNWIQDYTGNQFAVPNYLTGRRFNGRIMVKF
ncbi:MAG: TonB-dependent receptor [Chitinophagales bacterium]|nr:TonB-dependent receptor [Chitinophagales bacterium]